MLKVNDSIRNAYKQKTTQRKSYIKVGDNSFFIQNLDVSGDAYNEGNVIGNAIAKIAKFDIETEYVKNLDEFELFDGIWTGEKYEYVSLGTFKLFEEQGTDEFFSSITSYDKLILFNKPYDNTNVSFPISLYNFLKEICSQANVELETKRIANGDKILFQNLFVEGETLKQILKAICQISGNFAKIKNDKLVLGLYDYDSYIATGNEIVLEDVVEEKTKIKQYGYTKQNVYSGKNKNVRAEEVKAGSSNVANAFTNLTEYDGYKNVVEVSSSVTWMTLSTNGMSPDFYEKVETGGFDVTTMLLIKKTDVNTRVNFYLGSITGGAVYNELKHYKDEANGWAWYYTTHTIPDNPGITTINNHISSPETNFATFYIAKIQTLIGSTPSDFEPYVGGKASPSPDYPQEIEVGRGKNLLSVPFTQYNANNLRAEMPNFKAGTYTFSFKGSLVATWQVTARKIVNGTQTQINAVYNAYSLTFTLDEEATLQLEVYRTGILLSDISEEQLEKSPKATSYLPYNTIESKSTGKNLLKGLSTPLDDTNYWHTTTSPYFTPLEDGWGKFEYDNTSGTSNVFINAKVKLDAVDLKENTTYTFLTEIRNSNISENSGAFFQIVTSNPTIAFSEASSLGYSNINTGGVFKKVLKTKESFNGIDVAIDSYLRLATGTKGTVEARITLVEGDYATKDFVYEPYKESSIQYNLGDNFLADKEYIENGVLNKKVRKYVFTGEETFATSGSSYTFKKSYLTNPDLPVYETTNYECSHFKKHGNANEIGRMYVGNNNLNFNYDNLVGGVDAFKTYLAEQYANGTPMEFYYLTTDTEQIPLETTGELRTFEPNTIITNDLDSEMEVEYGKYIKIDKDELYQPEYKRTTWNLNKVVLGMKDVEGEFVSKQDDADVEENGTHQLVINDNPFVYTQQLREEYIDQLFERIKGFGYVAFESGFEGIPYYELGDLIKIEDKKSIILRYNLQSPKGLESTFSAPSIIDSVVEYTQTPDPLSQKLRSTELRVDKAEGNIEATTKKVESIDMTVNNNYQNIINKFGDYTPTSQTVQLEQSVKQIQTDTYTKTEINTKLIDGSVTKVITTSGTFDEDGMHYEKTGAPTKSTINEAGVSVDSSSSGEELLFAGYDKDINQTIVRTENLTVRRYLVVGENTRIEDYTDEDGNVGGGIFIL